MRSAIEAAVGAAVARTYCARTEVLGGGSASNGCEKDHGLLHLDGGVCGGEQRLLGLRCCEGEEMLGLWNAWLKMRWMRNSGEREEQALSFDG